MEDVGHGGAAHAVGAPQPLVARPPGLLVVHPVAEEDDEDEDEAAHHGHGHAHAEAGQRPGEADTRGQHQRGQRGVDQHRGGARQRPHAVVQPRARGVVCGCRDGRGSRGGYWGLQTRTVTLGQLGLIEVAEHTIVVVEGVGDDDLDVPVHWFAWEILRRNGRQGAAG